MCSLFSAKLESPCAQIVARKDMLLVITTACQVRVLCVCSSATSTMPNFCSDLRGSRTLFPPTSLSHLLDPLSSSITSTPLDIAGIGLHPNGVPIIRTTEPAAYLYDIARSEWTCILSRWYLEGSPSGEPRRAHSAPAGPLAEIEAEITGALDGRHAVDGDKPEWWNEAMEMGHLETRIRAAELLDSKEEYKHWLIRYAVVLGKEGFRARAEELVREMVGPIFQYVVRIVAGTS